MSVLTNVIPSYLSSATDAEKKGFFQALLHLSSVDGYVDDTEIEFINNTAKENGITEVNTMADYEDEAEVLENVKCIKERGLALELIYHMCMLSHADSVLSDEETLFIGKVGNALGIEMEKIEQISTWVIDHIIWLEQAKIIFEEK